MAWSSDIPLFEEMLLGDAAILIQDDPPDHTRFRKALTPWFRAASSDLFRNPNPMLESHIQKCLSGNVDAVGFGIELKDHVVAALFGFTTLQQETLADWSERFSAGVGIEFLEFEGARVERQREFVKKMHEELDQIIYRLIRTPPEPIKSLLDEINRNTEDKSITKSLFKTLIFASNHTLSNQVTNAISVLAEQSIEHQVYLAEFGNRHIIADEVTRIRPVFRGSHRISSKSNNLGDIQIEKGDYLIVWNGSANLDDSIFPDPEIISNKSRRKRHLSFGNGIHRCIGSALAIQTVTSVISHIMESKKILRIQLESPVNDPWVDGYSELQVNVS